MSPRDKFRDKSNKTPLTPRSAAKKLEEDAEAGDPRGGIPLAVDASFAKPEVEGQVEDADTSSEGEQV